MALRERGDPHVAVDRISAILRGATKSFQPRVKHDVIAVVGGGLLALLVMALHRILYDVLAAPWGM